jgi:hypothetical protein
VENIRKKEKNRGFKKIAHLIVNGECQMVSILISQELRKKAKEK